MKWRIIRVIGDDKIVGWFKSDGSGAEKRLSLWHGGKEIAAKIVSIRQGVDEKVRFVLNTVDGFSCTPDNMKNIQLKIDDVIEVSHKVVADIQELIVNEPADNVNKKTFIINGECRLWDYARVSTDELYGTIGNTGNLAFRYALYKNIGRKAELVSSNGTVDYINRNARNVVWPCANQLGVHANNSARYEFTRQLTVPVSVVGLGAQSDTQDSIPELPKGTVGWLESIAERSVSSKPNIAVRGEYTRRVIESIGLGDAVTVLGCPSLFISDDKRLGNTIEKNLQRPISRIAVAAGSPAKTQYSEVERQLYGLACKSGGSYVVQSPEFFVKFARGEWKDIKRGQANRILDFIGVEGDGLGERIERTRNHVRVFFDVDAWMENLRNHDFVVGNRIHGVMLALQAGVPALCIAHDSRIEELCHTMRIPHVKMGDLIGKKIDYDLLRKLAEFDPDEFDSNRKRLAQRYMDFLSSNNNDVSPQLRNIALS